MKKNNKYRSNNYNNQIYSLNYKFDSISVAGKFSGTALDLIKRYNELAKEAQSNANYIEAENFRQYAEHYRKIVTEINERKNARMAAEKEENNNITDSASGEDSENKKSESSVALSSVDSEKAVAKSETDCQSKSDEEISSEPKVAPQKQSKRSFKVIEINSVKTEKKTIKKTAAPKTKTIEDAAVL